MADQFWIKPADDKEIGGHCDTNSQRHIHNHSKEDAEEEQEKAMRRGEAIVATQGDPSEYPSNRRFNTAQTDVDDVGYDHPAKFNPGR